MGHNSRQPVHAAVPAALAPVALGCVLFDPTAASAGGIDGLRLHPAAPARTAADAESAGRRLLAAGNVPEALVAYGQALARDPGSIDALNGMAVCYDRLGRYDVSRGFYEAALSLDPQSPMLNSNYGYSLYLQGNRVAAARYLALAVASDDADARRASLAILARMDATAPRPRPVAAAAEPETEESARIVRTSDHEVRLVLGPSPATPAPVAAALGDAAAEVVVVAAVTPRQEQAIAEQEALLDKQDMLAALAAEQEAGEAAAYDEALAAADAAATTMVADADAHGTRPPWPDAVRRAMQLDRLAPTMALDDIAGLVAAPVPGGAAGDPMSYQHLLAADPRRQLPLVDRPDLKVALLAGQMMQRPKPRLAAGMQLLDPRQPSARRQFDAPFESDDSRLNGFAARIRGLDGPDSEDDVGARIARLQALLARVERA